MPTEQTGFAGYPSAVIYEQPVAGKTKGKRALQHLIWGDWLKVTDSDGDWRQVRSRGVEGWLHKDFIQPERLLEVNFVDIGQGDGCLIVTPKDRFILVDAGAGDNMYRFLRWRFGRFRRKVTFEAAIITHPDQDHYFGFQPLLEHEKVHFEAIYHNGIIERAAERATDRLGPKRRDAGTRTTYLTDVVADAVALGRILGDPDLVGRLRYPSMLKTTVDGGRVGDIRMLCVDDGFVPGYEADKALSMQVLGPVPELGPTGERQLRWFRDVGKTKNGHSVILRLVYRDVSMLLGGDLNVPAEEYLLFHYTGLEVPARTAAEEEALVAAARRTFESDVLKACHHGSADFTDVFLKAVNPAAVVVSSGDAEPHCHPRPDTLGALGKHSRGARPLIFSTELARSAEERIKHPFLLRQRFLELQQAIEEAETEAEKRRAREEFEEAVEQLERSVAVYGMICLRTDGHKVLFAQKLERPRSKSNKWDLHVLEPGPDGRLRYMPEHGG
jgi:beta-lactamase superfamily II metal-dependent hydrolase